MAKCTTGSAQDDTLKAYFMQIKNIPLSTFEEELELSRLIEKGDETAKKRLVEANLRLVIKIARTFMTTDVALMDLIQEGNLGLMTAAGKYSYTKNVRFSTYAGWWIRQAIYRYMVNRRRTIRLPHRKEETLRKIQKVYHSLAQALERQPRIEEIAEQVGVSPADVERLFSVTTGFVPVETDMGSDEYNVIMDMYEDHTYSPERLVMRKSSQDATLRALGTLKKRERHVLMHRYQLYGREHQTLKTIGDTMGISAETVRRIERSAIEKMRGFSDDLHPYFIEAI